MRRIAFAAVALALAGCTGGGGVQRAPEPFGTVSVAAIEDNLIAAAIKAKLAGDDPDSATTLRVASRDGVVTLSGTVRDAAAHRRDVAEARAVAGVEQVVDRLRVDPRGPRPGRQIADAALAARIVAAYTATVGLQHVTVTVDRGAATLGGTVADAPTRDRIVATARATDGIRNVVDRIRVERP
jgi:hyperosmotically inducible periplasmic protein